ncbi:MAG TPA: glyoxalase, partial [Sulfitobacter pontiacus]|nr:glyoxalase [Sulfitobacter pontiacus]
IERQHLADATVMIVERSQRSLSEDRSPKDPYR